MEISGYDIDKDGYLIPRFEKKETFDDKLIKDPSKVVAQALTTGKGVDKFADMFDIQKDIPAMSMPGGGVGNIPNAAYKSEVEEAILGNFAPGMKKDEAVRDFMGLPVETPTKKTAEKAVPAEFIQAVQGLEKQSKGDADTFLEGLVKLWQNNYLDNDAVTARVAKIIDLNKKKDLTEYSTSRYYSPEAQ